MSWQQLLLVATPAVPLGMCLAMLVPRFRSAVCMLLPAASLPALAAALWLPAGTSQPLPLALLGVGLATSDAGRLFLGVAALIWTLSAVHARSSVRERPGYFAGWWLATLSGNMLLFIAADVVTFYLAFALLSLAAFGLVIHSGTAEAMRAARVYLVLAIVGETCLLAGMLFAAHAADTLLITDMPSAIEASPRRDLTLALLVAGFGIKAGLMPLHVWLPLAHPAAPVPASAVLSGAIVKAGIYGLAVFLPLGAGLAQWSDLLMAMGLLTAFLGALLGLAQQRPKTVLAYSTLSQMGIVIAVLGAGLAVADPGAILAVTALYAAHHGLAKGALFLSVSVLSHRGGRRMWLLWSLAALLCLAIAGLPLTGGALAKLALKTALDSEGLLLLLALSGAATTLPMLRFLQLAFRSAPQTGTRASRAELLSFVTLALAAALLPWLGFAAATGLTAGYGLAPVNLWATLWPILLGAALFLAGAAMVPRGWRHRIPEGDIIVAAGWLRRHTLAMASRIPRRQTRAGATRKPGHLRTGPVEQWLGQWRIAGLMLLGLIGLLIFAR